MRKSDYNDWYTAFWCRYGSWLWKVMGYMGNHIDAFILYLHNMKNTSENTEMSYRRDLYKVQVFMEKRGISEVDAITKEDVETLQIIVNQTVEFVENSDAFDYDIFRNNALDALIAQLQENGLYTDIVAIAELYSIDTLCTCENAFYIARI